MKTLGTLSMAVLLLLMAGSVRIFAQDADRPPQAQEEKTKPNDKEKDKDKGAAQEERRDKDQPGMKQEEKKGEQPGMKEERHEHPMAQKPEERGEHQHAMNAKQGKKIPDDKFRSHFGQQHKVRVNQLIHTTTIVPGQTQFVASGFTFVFVDPWPVGWAFTDDCYIDFIDDEYVLVNPFHPGVFVALTVIG